MFTGIVQGLGTVINVEKKPGLTSFTVETPAGFAQGLEIGASVGIDGVCLTVIGIDGDRLGFDAMEETLRKTTIGLFAEGTRVNVERSFHVGKEVGGHIVSGHVTGMAEIAHTETPENNRVLTFRVPTEWMKYFHPKGFVALDGCSLTVVDVDKAEGTFTVWLIPETLRLTGFGFKQTGDRVNVEIDSRTQTIVDTVETYLKEYGNQL